MWCLEVLVELNKKAAEKERKQREQEQTRVDEAVNKVLMPRKEAV